MMEPPDAKADLHRYLQGARDALLWKLAGLAEYDIRRPLTPTGTNLLGLVKHLAGLELGYFGETFGRPFDEPLPWFDAAAPNADMWATAAESRASIVGLYQRAWAHADATIATLALDAPGHVPWWPDDRRAVTLHRILVHMIAETIGTPDTRTLCANSLTGPLVCGRATPTWPQAARRGGRPIGSGSSVWRRKPARTGGRGL